MCLALVLSGCESPTDGAAGGSGVNGPGTFTTGVVDAAALEAVYALTDTVVVTSGVTSVDGLIPAGKTLFVVGDTKAVNVTDGETFEVAGVLEIKAGATLRASGISGTDGTLNGAGLVRGDGAVALPVHNSDRDCRYCSHLYVEKLKTRGLRIRRQEEMRCYENANAERLKGILKQEYGLGCLFRRKKQALAATDEAVFLHNTKRPHLSLNYETPEKTHRKVA
jgi:hypothetical protein